MNEEIVSKIKKLLRLGQSDNEHEAALAAASAQRLMEKHSISQVMLQTEDDNESVGRASEPLYEGGKKRSQWRVALASVISKVNGCLCFTSRGTIHIIGRPSDIEASRYLFKYCEREITRLSKNYAGNGRSWINNYKLGAVMAVRDKLQEAKEQARAEVVSEHGVAATNAIALVDQRSAAVKVWAKQNEQLRDAPSFGRQRYSPSAREVGYSDGRSINLGSGKGLGAGGGRLKG